VIGPSPPPVRGSGTRGKRKTPPPETLPEPDSFPDGIPPMVDAALLSQPGRIDQAVLTSPARFHHGRPLPAPVDEKALAERYFWQTDFAIQALNASFFPSPRRRGHPTGNVLDTALVIRLAYLWRQARGEWPKRHFDRTEKRDYGPFLELATTCLRSFRLHFPTSRDIEEIVRNILRRLPM
jgi:hypothetical protein